MPNDRTTIAIGRVIAVSYQSVEDGAIQRTRCFTSEVQRILVILPSLYGVDWLASFKCVAQIGETAMSIDLNKIYTNSCVNIFHVCNVIYG